MSARRLAVRTAATALLLVAACATARVQPPADVEHVHGSGYAGVIVSADFGARYYVSQRRLWTPTRALVADYERLLARRLPREQLPPTDLWANVRRRYLGMFEHETGRKLMLVQLLCTAVYSEDHLGLPTFQSIPRDSCVCESWYDPSRRQVLDFGCGAARPADRASPPPAGQKPLLEPAPLPPNGEPLPPDECQAPPAR